MSTAAILPSGFFARRYAECVALVLWLRRRWLVTLAAFAGYAAAQHWLCVNWTGSLPYHLVWIEYGAKPDLNDLMVYRFEGRPFPDEDLRGLRFFKRVGGIAGERITVNGRLVQVSGRTIGLAKLRAKSGEPLDTISPGIIPPNHYFAQSDSVDSFDSRYAQCGLVAASQVIGIAHVIF